MGLETISRIVNEAYDRAIASGVPGHVAKRALMRAEAEMVQSEIESMKAFRDLVRSEGTRVVAERYGITPRAVRYRMERALNEIGNAKAA